MAEIEAIPSPGKKYRKESLMDLDPVLLGALLRERVHHNIEVPLYPVLLRQQLKPIPNFGLQAQLVFDVWRERGLSEEGTDLEWVKRYIDIAARIRKGERPDIPELEASLPKPFTGSEMDVVRKLIWGRCSIRDWTDKPVPDSLIEQIMEAGRAAPVGCNLDAVRFIVLRTPGEKSMIWSDISTDNAVIIVICFDNRISATVGQDRMVPQNLGYDAAAAADHMLLMAHALGLGGVWLSKTVKSDHTEDTGRKFKELYGLPDHIDVALHIAVGWPASGIIKSKRVPLSEMIITKKT
ncbi:MAG: nitroreductase family protein [Thermovirgaceae bacterium]|nr:nitroreductase family protein [Thermovirgaceae bacterium]